MSTIEEILKQLNTTDLLPCQQKLVKKLENKAFEISKKTTYYPLYELLETVFITEYPASNSTRAIAQIFLDNQVNNIHSGYRDFRYSGLMYLSFLSDDTLKNEIFTILTENSNEVIHQKRMKRFREETLLDDALTRFERAKDDLAKYHGANKVIFSCLQILTYLPESSQQITKLNEIIAQKVAFLKQLLPNIKQI